MRRAVGGNLGIKELALLSGSDLDARSRQHRPADRQTLRAAAIELHQRGLRPHDIGTALELSLSAVHDLLGVPE